MQYNYSDEEMQFLKMNLKLREELGRVNYEIDKLEDRRRDLIALIDAEIDLDDLGEAQEETLEDYKARLDKALFGFIKQFPGTRRAVILESFTDYDADEIRRAIDRLRRRGLIINEGRAKSSKWYAVENA